MPETQKELFNVSKCPFYFEGQCMLSDERYEKSPFITNCMENPNCLYKELVRKSELCENLIAANNFLSIALGARRSGKKTFTDLAIENAELRLKISEQEKQISELWKGIKLMEKQKEAKDDELRDNI